MKHLLIVLSLLFFVNPVLANPAGDLIAQRNLNRGRYIVTHLPQELAAIDAIIKEQVDNGARIYVVRDYGYLSNSPAADVQLGLAVEDHYALEGWAASHKGLDDDSIRLTIHEP